MIRIACRDDVPALASLVASYRAESDPAVDVRSITADAGEQFARSLDDTEHRIVYVACVEGDVRGYAIVHWVPLPLIRGTEGYLSDLVVRSDARGQGIGGELLAAVEKAARDRGCVRLMLNNGHDAESYRRGFYAKHGVVERTRVANFVKRL